MKSWLTSLACAATLAAVPAAGFAAPATELEKFEGKVEKFTSSGSFVANPKRLCVYIDDDNANDERMAGVLVDVVVTGSDGLQRVQVRCFVRRFAADGSAATSEACSSRWAPLR